METARRRLGVGLNDSHTKTLEGRDPLNNAAKQNIGKLAKSLSEYSVPLGRNFFKWNCNDILTGIF